MTRKNYENPSRIELVTAAATTPVTLAEVKTHLNITTTDYDALLTALLTAATDLVEKYLKRITITTEFHAWYDFGIGAREAIWEGTVQASRRVLSPRVFWLPRVPLQSIEEVKTYDRSNNDTVYAAANYYVDSVDDNMQGRMILEDGATMPASLRDILSMSIQFKAGYGDTTADVPEGIRQGVLQLTAYLYQNRGDCDGKALEESGTKNVLSPYVFMGYF